MVAGNKHEEPLVREELHIQCETFAKYSHTHELTMYRNALDLHVLQLKIVFI